MEDVKEEFVQAEPKTSISIPAQNHAFKMIEAGVSRQPAINKLVNRFDVDPIEAASLYDEMQSGYDVALKDQATKDMTYGALWCGGGTIATLADTGFIFWGAIVFGGYQLIKGIVNYTKYNKVETGKVIESDVLDRD